MGGVVVPAIYPGDPVKLFDANAVAAPVASEKYALGPAEVAKVITWTYSFASAPSGVSIQLQHSIDGVIWNNLDAGTATAGETRTTVATAARFIRANKASQTGGGALTVNVMTAF